VFDGFHSQRGDLPAYQPLQSDDACEGVTTFAERRRPRWTDF
jgi:hypothetical protein